VSGVNAFRRGPSGSRSKLFHEIVRVRELIERTAGLFVAKLLENVASMGEEAASQYSTAFRVKPVRICSSRMSWCRRPRLYWCNWSLEEGRGVVLEKGPWHNDAKLTAQRPPSASWALKGWHPAAGEEASFPTFLRARPCTRPPACPAGFDHCDAGTLQRWVDDNFQYSSYQYAEKYLMRNNRGQLRPPCAAEREAMMGFVPNFLLERLDEERA